MIPQPKPASVNQNAARPSPHAIPTPVFVKLVPADEPEVKTEDLRSSSQASLWQQGRELICQFGEWMGVSGPKATAMSRLTVAAVSLVLVSGVSLLMAPAETPRPVSRGMDVVPSADAPPSREATARHARGGNSTILQTQGNNSGQSRVESAAWQGTPSHRRGAWLEGTIEED